MPIDVDVVRRKVAWRVLPLIFVLYVIAYVDRMNVGFAMTRMKTDLDWSDDVFGYGIGLFFVGYLLLEIPGALLVEHWSARKWFCRILISWGICSMMMAFVAKPWQFYLVRFLLGLAEAGFFPGVIVYFTHWFRRVDRARAFSVLVFGVPVSQLAGSQLAALLIDQSWLDLSGWQWIFLIEGAPAVLMGIVVPFIMTDRPHQAGWLTREESDWLEGAIQQEQAESAAAHTMGLGQALRQPSVWILALGILATNTGGYAMGFWLPTFIENMLKAPAVTNAAVTAVAQIGSPAGDGPLIGTATLAGGLATPTNALRFLGFVYLLGLAGVIISGQSSDRTGERKWHCVAGQVGAGVFLMISLIPGQPFWLVMVWLCGMGFFAQFWPSPFWVLPTMSMSASAAAVSIGFINICANVGGMLGSPIVGKMKATGFEDVHCMILLACCYALGGVIIACLVVKRKAS